MEEEKSPFEVDFGENRTLEIKEAFDYDSLWNNEEKKKEKNIVSELPRGLPRKGIKGRYLKKKVHVGRVQLKRSWGSFYETNEGKDIVSD